MNPAAQSNPNNDVVVPNSPSDTVSSMLFSPTSNHLVTASWNKVRQQHHRRR
jgi:hypothetical protein